MWEMELLQEVTENRSMENESFFSAKMIIAFLVGIIIGFLGTWVSMREPADKIANVDINDEISEDDEASGAVLSDRNAILVRDQKAGTNVDIELVTLENVGWVVIHEDNNGALGNALGAQLFDVGKSKGVVELLRGTEAGKTYYATIRQDDGDHAFDLTKDILLLDEAGNPIQVKFKATDGVSATEDSSE